MDYNFQASWLFVPDFAHHFGSRLCSCVALRASEMTRLVNLIMGKLKFASSSCMLIFTDPVLRNIGLLQQPIAKLVTGPNPLGLLLNKGHIPIFSPNTDETTVELTS